MLTIQLDPLALPHPHVLDVYIDVLRNIRAVSAGEPWGASADLQRIVELGGAALPPPPAVIPAPVAAPLAPLPHYAAGVPIPDAAFAPPPPVPVAAPVPVAPPAGAQNADAPNVLLPDAAGVVWDGRIHSSNQKITKSSGMWQAKRNVSPALQAQVTAELLQRAAAATIAPPAPTAAPPAYVPPAPAPAPAAPPAPANEPLALGFGSLMKKIAAYPAQLPQETVAAILQYFQIPDIMALTGLPLDVLSRVNEEFNRVTGATGV